MHKEFSGIVDKSPSIKQLTTQEIASRQTRAIDISGVAHSPFVEIVLILIEDILDAGVQLHRCTT